MSCLIDRCIRFKETAERVLDSNGDAFVTPSGTVYPRIPCESEFLSQLAIALADPDKAQCIYRNFQLHLQPYIDQDMQQVLQKWIVENVRFIGFIPFSIQFRGEIPDSIKALMKTHYEQFAIFFDEIRNHEKPSLFSVVKDPKAPKNIVVITTTGGGGHKSVADGLEQILTPFSEKYHVTVLDIKDIFQSSDPLYCLSEEIGAEEVYDQIYQQHKEVELAQKLWELKPKLNCFVENTGMKDLKDRVRELEPDLILSTCHFLDRDLELSSALGIPLRWVHCDYEFNYGLVHTAPKLNPEIVKIWLPATDPEILTPISSILKSALVQQLHLSLDPTNPKSLLHVIDYAGYPTRSSFQRVTDPEQLAAIRTRFGVQQGEQVVVIQMGKQGVGVLRDLVKKLNEDRSVVYDFPTHVAVMCGTNKRMYEDLCQYIARTEQHPQLHFKILSLLGQKDVADYLSIANIELMKPGGATSAEALKMGVRTLIFTDPNHPWEAANKHQMLRSGIGTELQSLEALPQQLKELSCQPHDSSYELINVEETIPQYVDEAIKSFEIFTKTHSREMLTDSVFTRTPVEETTQVYQMLRDFHDIMTKYNIRYWMDGGTYLGAQRNQGVIPWDDDGDVCILEEDTQKLFALEKELDDLGYRLDHDHPLAIKLFPKDKNYPSIDVFPMRKDPESGMYILANPIARELWPKEMWTEEEVRNIIPYQFGPFNLMGVKDSDRYLKTLYGEDYMDVAYQIWNHSEDTRHEYIPVRLVDKKPAAYGDVVQRVFTISRKHRMSSSGDDQHQRKDDRSLT